MQYATIGTSNLKSSKIILGTWQAGKADWADIDDKDTTEAIRGALDLGINTIDTAIVYGSGYSERIIAAALRGIPREQYQLATKVFANHLKYDQVLSECAKSLSNLNTDYIDLYQIHWPSGSWGSAIVPIQETMHALNYLQEQGKIKHIGVSNFNKAQLSEALQYGNVISNQPPYSLIWRQYDQDTNPYCRAHNIGILAYSPLAQGILTGKFKSDHKFAAADHRARNKLMQPDIFKKIEQVLAGMQKYANKYSTSLGNIAINWVISQPNTFAIVGVRNLTQLQQNVKACDFNLSSEELAELDQLSTLVTAAMDQNTVLWQ